MKLVSYLVAIGGISACVAVADDVQTVSAELSAALTSQLQILQQVQDSSSAAAAVTPLREKLAALREMNETCRIPTTDLWRHIENTPELKNQLVLCLQHISIHYYRIEMADFYGCAELRQLLTPLLVPASPRPEEEAE